MKMLSNCHLKETNRKLSNHYILCVWVDMCWRNHYYINKLFLWKNASSVVCMVLIDNFPRTQCMTAQYDVCVPHPLICGIQDEYLPLSSLSRINWLWSLWLADVMVVTSFIGEFQLSEMVNLGICSKIFQLKKLKFLERYILQYFLLCMKELITAEI